MVTLQIAFVFFAGIFGAIFKPTNRDASKAADFCVSKKLMGQACLDYWRERRGY